MTPYDHLMRRLHIKIAISLFIGLLAIPLSLLLATEFIQILILSVIYYPSFQMGSLYIMIFCMEDLRWR